MTARRHVELLGMLKVDSTDPATLLRRVCELCVDICGVSGAAIVVHGADDGTAQAVACATDPVSLVLDDLQRTVGEGPRVAARALGGPVLVGDLATAGARWPAFTSEAQSVDVAAVFSFPLHVGAVRVGTLDLHRDSEGSLGWTELRDALTLADIATHLVLDDLDGPDPMDVGWLSDVHAVVHQATGVVSVQLDISMHDALSRIRAHAYAHRTPLDEVSRQIVGRDLYLEIGD